MSATLAGMLSVADVGADALDPVMQVMGEAFEPAWGEAWTRGQCAGLLGLPGVWLTLARRDTTPVGFALSRVVLDEAGLLLLAVTPGQRRRGVASVLLDRALAAAARRGAERMHLEMRDGNAALALYRRHGFDEVGRRPAYYRGAGGRSFDAVTLSRAIANHDPVE